jgi:hypothetical protein
MDAHSNKIILIRVQVTMVTVWGPRIEFWLLRRLIL